MFVNGIHSTEDILTRTPYNRLKIGTSISQDKRNIFICSAIDKRNLKYFLKNILDSKDNEDVYIGSGDSIFNVKVN